MVFSLFSILNLAELFQLYHGDFRIIIVSEIYSLKIGLFLRYKGEKVTFDLFT